MYFLSPQTYLTATQQVCNFMSTKYNNTTYDVDKIESAMIDQSLIIHRKKDITLTIGGYTVTGINFATIIIVSGIHG